MKIVINTCMGGFSLSEQAQQLLGCNCYGYLATQEQPISRADPRLVALVDQLGPAAAGVLAALKIVEIPEGVQWFIMEENGQEWVAEQHRIWD